MHATCSHVCHKGGSPGPCKWEEPLAAHDIIRPVRLGLKNFLMATRVHRGTFENKLSCLNFLETMPFFCNQANFDAVHQDKVFFIASIDASFVYQSAELTQFAIQH